MDRLPALPDTQELAAGWETAERVLCVRLDTLGDVLMSTPAIRAVKESRPGRHVTLLTAGAGAGAAALVPELDDVIVYDAPWMKATPSRADSRHEYDMAARLREGNYDAAIIFTVYSQNPLPTALLCYLAGIPLRLAHCRENPYQLLTTWVPETEPEQGTRHEVRRQLDLVAAVGYEAQDERLSVAVPPGARRRVGEILAEVGVDPGRPWLVIHPGASAASRRYPPRSFAQAAGSLVRDHGFQVVWTGKGAEEELVSGIQDGVGAGTVSLVDRLNLGELAALLSLAPLLISNNSGPAHLAAALGTPVVDLYALTNPQHTPWAVPHRLLFHDVPCKYCYKSVCPLGHNNCLRLVPPGAVVEAALDLLAEVRNGGTP
jgi:lipopolysaccharide heptosyltransferase II